MSSVILAIVGCRDYDDFDHFCSVVDRYIKYHNLRIEKIISGEAPGVDDMAEDYALSRGYAFQGYPADWDGLGGAAGFIRNDTITDEATNVLAFWDKKTTGTKDTIDKALKKRRNVTTIPIQCTEKRYYCARKREEWNRQRKAKQKPQEAINAAA